VFLLAILFGSIEESLLAMGQKSIMTFCSQTCFPADKEINNVKNTYPSVITEEFMVIKQKNDRE
jgi:hypothetical protein